MCDGIADMASAVVSTLRDPEAARTQAERGRLLVCQRYDWDALAEAGDFSERYLHHAV